MSDHKQRTGKTKVGKFLQSLGDKAAPLAKVALSIAGDVTGIDQLKELSNQINKSDLPEQDKEIALALIEQDKIELQEITKRWQSDMNSDSWLPKNIRPMVLIYMLILMTCVLIGDSLENNFEVDDNWVDLIKALLITVFFAYFGSRGAEKLMRIFKGKK